MKNVTTVSVSIPRKPELKIAGPAIINIAKKYLNELMKDWLNEWMIGWINEWINEILLILR